MLLWRQSPRSSCGVSEAKKKNDNTKKGRQRKWKRFAKLIEGYCYYFARIKQIARLYSYGFILAFNFDPPVSIPLNTSIRFDFPLSYFSAFNVIYTFIDFI